MGAYLGLLWKVLRGSGFRVLWFALARGPTDQMKSGTADFTSTKSGMPIESGPQWAPLGTTRLSLHPPNFGSCTIGHFKGASSAEGDNCGQLLTNVAWPSHAVPCHSLPHVAQASHTSLAYIVYTRSRIVLSPNAQLDQVTNILAARPCLASVLLSHAKKGRGCVVLVHHSMAQLLRSFQM